MDLQAKLDSIQEQKQSLLEMTPSEHRSKNLSKLYADVLDAKSTAQNAPFRVKAAEQRYYRVRDGANGYQDHLLQRYAKDGRELRDRMLAQHNSQLEEVNQSLSYYESVRVYLRNISEVQVVLLTRIRSLLDKIRMSEVETTYRKTYFMEQVQTTLGTRIVMCNLFILSYIGLMVYVRRDQLEEPIIAGSIFVLFLLVFGLSYLIKGITSLPLSLNVYTEFGYDPMESKQQWYFIIPISMSLLWIYLRYFN
jgi:hypothetical protein